MTEKEKKDLLETIEYELTYIKDQDVLYKIFRSLAHNIPNDAELGQAIRLLFISNLK
jgi:hypothetical protein